MIACAYYNGIYVQASGHCRYAPSAALLRHALSFSVGSMTFALTTVAGVLTTVISYARQPTDKNWWWYEQPK